MQRNWFKCCYGNRQRKNVHFWHIFPCVQSIVEHFECSTHLLFFPTSGGVRKSVHFLLCFVQLKFAIQTLWGMNMIKKQSNEERAEVVVAFVFIFHLYWIESEWTGWKNDEISMVVSCSLFYCVSKHPRNTNCWCECLKLLNAQMYIWYGCGDATDQRWWIKSCFNAGKFFRWISSLLGRHET